MPESRWRRTAGTEMPPEEHGACLNVVLPGPLRVVGDAGQLRQVLLIPLDDALKHTSAGGPFAIGVQRRGSRARIEVRDTGPGNAPRDLPHVFDRCQESPRAALRTMRVSRTFMRRNPAPVDQCRGIARRRWGTSLAG